MVLGYLTLEVCLSLDGHVSHCHWEKCEWKPVCDENEWLIHPSCRYYFQSNKRCFQKDDLIVLVFVASENQYFYPLFAVCLPMTKGQKDELRKKFCFFWLKFYKN